MTSNMNKKVFIKQDGTIPGHRIIEELVKRGGKLANVIDYDSTFEMLGLYYYIKPNDDIYIASDLISDEYTELLYNKEADSFYEETECSDCVNDKGCINCKDGDMKETYWGEKAPSAQEGVKSMRMVSAEAKESLLPNESTLSEKEKETIREKITYILPEIESFAIPEGYEAVIEDGKVIVRKKRWQPKEGETYYWVDSEVTNGFFVVEDKYTEGCCPVYEIFQTEEEAQAFCDKLNAAIAPIIEQRRKEVEG